MIDEYKWLHLVWYEDLTIWSAQYYIADDFKFNKNFELKTIGSFLKRSKKQIFVEDNVEYKRVTVKTNNGGCCLRDVAMGNTIGTKIQYVIAKGQFIVSKIDARNGAFGLVPDELNNAIVTNDFPVFGIDEKIVHPQFFLLLTATNKFKSFAQSCSNGTTNRQRLDLPKFMNVKIPTPSLAKQIQLTESYNKKIDSASGKEMLCSSLEQEIQTYLNEVLNIEIDNNNKKHVFNIVYSDESSRWDVDFFIPQNKFVSKYDYTTLDECLDSFMTDTNGTSLRVETYKNPEKKYSYIGMENIEKGTGILTEFQYVNGIDIKSQTIRVPKNYFLYGKLRPYLNKYWYNESDENNIVCSSEFFVFSIKNKINPYYFKYYISSNYVQKQIEKLFQGARMPRINENTFKTIKIPLPPIEVQNEISKHISELKTEIDSLKRMAKDLRRTAMKEFENEIFEN